MLRCLTRSSRSSMSSGREVLTTCTADSNEAGSFSALMLRVYRLSSPSVGSLDTAVTLG